ncbi:hypothetical protein PV326_000647 [Microctonus aethiopoides]|nr:hypothetical protein PV326_000647 [Microctonus aethiopoides]
MSFPNSLSMCYNNTQISGSLRAHVADVSFDRIAMKSNFLILFDTWLDNDDHIDIPNFYLIVKFKRNIGAGEVAKYHNNNDIKYKPEVSKILGKTYNKLSMILSGDFNTNFGELTSKPSQQQD